MKQLLLLFLLPVFFTACNSMAGVSQPNSSQKNYSPDLPPNANSGKCFAKCLIPDQLKKHTQEYIIYTGDESKEEVDIEKVEIEIQAASTKWIKKRSSKNCLSDDPNDCYVKCLVEIPALTKTLNILKDTTQSKNYKIENIEITRISHEDGFTEWRPVLCSSQITNKIVYQIRTALKEKGYKPGFEDSLDKKTKKALSKFQKENNLPMGQLDFITLDALGVKY